MNLLDRLRRLSKPEAWTAHAHENQAETPGNKTTFANARLLVLTSAVVLAVIGGLALAANINNHHSSTSSQFLAVSTPDSSDATPSPSATPSPEVSTSPSAAVPSASTSGTPSVASGSFCGNGLTVSSPGADGGMGELYVTMHLTNNSNTDCDISGHSIKLISDGRVLAALETDPGTELIAGSSLNLQAGVSDSCTDNGNDQQQELQLQVDGDDLPFTSPYSLPAFVVNCSAWDISIYGPSPTPN